MLPVVVAVVALVAACAPPERDGAGTTGETAPFVPITLAPPASMAEGPLDAELAGAVDAVVASPLRPPPGTVDRISASGDLRLAWLLVDVLRLDPPRDVADQCLAALSTMVGAPPADGQDAAVAFADLLVRWDVPAPDGYAGAKRRLLTAFDPAWAAMLEGDAWEGLDWRQVGPGDPSADAVEPLVDPSFVSAGEGGRWLPDADRVVGLEIDGEVRAYPVRVLAAHTVVLDEVGDRRVALVDDPVAGTIAVYEIGPEVGATGAEDDDAAAPAVELAGSGLTLAGAQLLVDPATGSLVDPVTGAAATGVWWSSAVRLTRVPFTLTTWREWRVAHTDTVVVAADGGVGRVYLTEPYADVPAPARALGVVDDRLGPGARVLAVDTGAAGDDAPVVAFPVELAELTIVRGEPVEAAGVTLSLVAGGLVATSADGARLPALVTAWADWSRLHPETALWDGVG